MPVLKSYTNEANEAVRARAVDALASLRAESSFYGPDDDEPGVWGIAPFVYNDASDEHDHIARVNYETVLADLQAIDGSGAYEAVVRHWVGGIPIHFIVFRVDNIEAVESLVLSVDAYESYPVLDDERLSRLEAEDWERFLADTLIYDHDLNANVDADAIVGDLAHYLGGSHEVWGAENIAYDNEAWFQDIVRAWLLNEGHVEPDPERGEEPRSAVEDTLLLFQDLTRQRQLTNLKGAR